MIAADAPQTVQKSASEAAEEYRIQFPDTWKSCKNPVFGKEFLWTVRNFNYTVWAEDADVATWVDDKAKEVNEMLVCNIYKFKKTPGIGCNFYDDTVAFFRERFPQYKLIKRGTQSIAGRKSKWQIAQIDQLQNMQHFFLCRPNGNVIYYIYFWGNASQIEGRYDELQKIVESFSL